MPHRLTSPRNQRFARNMRADATKTENMLWQAIRNKQLEGLKFKRQALIGNYIVDFVCFEQKFILEVDGGQHAESRRDETRDAWLATQGFKVVRLWNDQVERNLDGVCLTILRETGQ